MDLFICSRVPPKTASPRQEDLPFYHHHRVVCGPRLGDATYLLWSVGVYEYRGKRERDENMKSCSRILLHIYKKRPVALLPRDSSYQMVKRSGRIHEHSKIRKGIIAPGKNGIWRRSYDRDTFAIAMAEKPASKGK